MNLLLDQTCDSLAMSLQREQEPHVEDYQTILQSSLQRKKCLQQFREKFGCAITRALSDDEYIHYHAQHLTKRSQQNLVLSMINAFPIIIRQKKEGQWRLSSENQDRLMNMTLRKISPNSTDYEDKMLQNFYESLDSLKFQQLSIFKHGLIDPQVFSIMNIVILAKFDQFIQKSKMYSKIRKSKKSFEKHYKERQHSLNFESKKKVVSSQRQKSQSREKDKNKTLKKQKFEIINKNHKVLQKQKQKQFIQNGVQLVFLKKKVENLSKWNKKIESDISISAKRRLLSQNNLRKEVTKSVLRTQKLLKDKQGLKKGLKFERLKNTILASQIRVNAMKQMSRIDRLLQKIQDNNQVIITIKQSQNGN